MADNKFDTTVSSLFKGMDGFLSAKTVVGEPVTVNDTIILPLVDVSFGVAAGAGSNDNKNKAAGGMGGKMSPSDMIPDIIDKIKSFKDGKKDPDIEKAVDDAINE